MKGCTRLRFEKGVQGNSEIAYFLLVEAYKLGNTETFVVSYSKDSKVASFSPLLFEE